MICFLSNTFRIILMVIVIINWLLNGFEGRSIIYFSVHLVQREPMLAIKYCLCVLKCNIFYSNVIHFFFNFVENIEFYSFLAITKCIIIKYVLCIYEGIVDLCFDIFDFKRNFFFFYLQTFDVDGPWENFNISDKFPFIRISEIMIWIQKI